MVIMQRSVMGKQSIQ